MTAGALVLALTLSAGDTSSSTEVDLTRSQGQPAWSTIESQHFEIHYLPGLAAELGRVIKVAEQAYGRVSGRLNFVLPTRVPVVVRTEPASTIRSA